MSPTLPAVRPPTICGHERHRVWLGALSNLLGTVGGAGVAFVIAYLLWNPFLKPQVDQWLNCRAGAQAQRDQWRTGIVRMFETNGENQVEMEAWLAVLGRDDLAPQQRRKVLPTLRDERRKLRETRGKNGP